ncbi:MAG: hypothetical protein PHV99_02615 [Candidatus Pacebacteria bacterium]|nr:hypothetical protein [Candidatus Paceibacterota bacterium]
MTATEDSVHAIKIILKGYSRVSVGMDLAKGDKIAIGQCLMSYNSGLFDDCPPVEFESGLSFGWETRSSPIVALFKERGDAQICLAAEDARPCDERWLEHTKRVLTEIGDVHPFFHVCQSAQLALVQ